MDHILNMNGCGIDCRDFATLARAVRDSGIDGLDMPVPSALFHSAQDARSGGKLMRELGLTWGLFQMPMEALSETVDDAAFARAMDALRFEAELALEAGCTATFSNLWSGSNSRAFDENLAWMQQRIRRVWDLFKPMGVRYGLEFLGPVTLQKQFRHPFIRRLSGAVGLLDQVDPALGFVFDVFHWYCSGAHREDLVLAQAQCARILTVHLNDALPGGCAAQQDLQRGMPLEYGVIDAPMVVRKLKQAGYDGPVTLEPLLPWKEKLSHMPVEQALSEAAAQYRKTMALV